MAQTISRIASSSSTTRIRSGITVVRILSAILRQLLGSESNHRGPETASITGQSMVFRGRALLRLDEEASQTRGYCVAKNATLRGSPRFLTSQRTLVRNDNKIMSASLWSIWSTTQPALAGLKAGE